MDFEKEIYDYLTARGFTVDGACAVLGNMHAESACNPNNAQNSGNARLGMTDAEYTDGVDKGTYTNFVKDSIGYGLCQWTYWSRKQGLLNLAKTRGKSISDISVQLDFMLSELKSYGLLYKIKNAKDYAEATKVFMLQYEKPANQSAANVKVRVGYSDVYYKRFANPLDRALSVLVANGVINSPDYWKKAAPTVKFLPELLQKMA